MRRIPITLLIILLILLIGLGYFITNPEAGQEILVELGLAEPVEKGYIVTGMLETQITYLAGENGGRVDSVLVNEGQTVQPGELLVQLDPSYLELQLEIAQAQLDAAEAQLELLLDGPRQVDLDVAQAAAYQAEVIWDGAIQALNDAREFTPEAIRDEQVSLVQASVDQAQAGWDLANANLEALEAGASDAEIQKATAAVTAAEAEVGTQATKLEAQSITAPHGGVILEQLLLPGEYALPGQPLITLADLSELDLIVYLPEAELSWANVGDQVKFTVDAYADRIYSGEIVWISDNAEFTPRNVQTPEDRVILVYEVSIRVPNLEGLLKPGLPAQVTFGVQP
jgi:HlyD family secretion protein